MNVENNENLNEFVIIIPRLDENGNQVQDENGNQVTKSDEESNQVKGEKELGHPKLTKQQEDIRNFCSIPRTAQEIMDRLGITNQSKNRQRHIQQLLDMGILEMTNPENPTANNQKYRRAPKK
ncbi:MAG: helix-turn-helix transcriptional regulator [Bacteroidaceae bacterium]|nr:helix-turn-helix transcriptional regulator [Bacteroidaceae bacterium]